MLRGRHRGLPDALDRAIKPPTEFKRPKQIHITEAIPRTATGKIQRRVVAQAFAAKA